MASKPVGIKDDVLNDLATRFLINIPDEDKDDPLKLCSHIEIAHWFYLDLIRPEDPSLPGCSMKEFMATIFKHCPFLVRDSVVHDLDTLHTQWKNHKYRKPTRGAIILNQDFTKCLLVQGYPASTSWGFPKGKLESGESDKDCAIREVYEETGFDIRALIQSDQYLEYQSQDNERVSQMYIIPGVPENTVFKPRVRKEIGNIEWFRLDDLPRRKKDLTTRQNIGKSSNFFMIMPFISQLRRWISHQKRSQSKSTKPSRSVSATFHNPTQQQQRRSTSSPSKTSAPTQRPVSNKSPLQLSRASPQSVPNRAVSGPVGMKSQSHVNNPMMSASIRAGTTHPRMNVQHKSSPPVIQSHSIPNTVAFQGQIGHPVSSPHSQIPPTHHYPPRYAIGHTHAPIPRHVTLLQTPRHPHPHTSPASQPHYIPHPTSVFNPVIPSPNRPSNFISQQNTPVTHASTPPADKFNPFAALGISTTTVSATSSKGAIPTQPVSTPYQWDGNRTLFRPVQVNLQPAQAWVRFKFDKSHILSTV